MPAMRDRFADRLAFKAASPTKWSAHEIRKAAVQKQTTTAKRECRALGSGGTTKAEKGLIWCSSTSRGRPWPPWTSLEPADLEGLASRSVLDLARKLKENSGILSLTAARASKHGGGASSSPASRARAKRTSTTRRSAYAELKRRRYERERAAVQREIDQLQQRGAPESPASSNALLMQEART